MLQRQESEERGSPDPELLKESPEEGVIPWALG